MFLKNLEGKKIILASQSPRRQELLKGAGLEFEVIVKEGIAEDFDPNMPFHEVAEYLAKKKAMEYIGLMADDTIVITADTIVCTETEILNKPLDALHAAEMLQKLSDSSHLVITGVCIKSPAKELCFSTQSTVYFTRLEPAEIDYYVNHFKPFDKAGAYGIQEWIGYIGITRIEGSYFNVMGLPVQRVYNELKNF